MRTLLLRLLVVMPLVLGTLLLPVSLFAAGGIATDGSLGQPSKIISTPGSTAHVVIEQNAGITKGTNLFHSFDHFNIAKDQTVTFKETINHSLDNIISRVTGGSFSTIEGLLEVTPEGHANFYLINPNGVTFGPKGSVNVKGDLHVTTADELRFSNGLKFSASQPNTSRLSAAAPSSFGFLGALPSNNSLIKIEDTRLQLNQGQQLDFSANQIQIIYSKLYALGGQIRLVAVNGAATLDLQSVLSLPDINPTLTNAGNITIYLSDLRSSSNGGGRIAMWGNDVFSKYSWILANNMGTNNAAKENGIVMHANTLGLETSLIATGVFGSGNGGKIQVIANNFSIDGGGDQYKGGILADTAASGNASTISIKVNEDLSMTNGASITSTSQRRNAAGDSGDGDAGNILITAKNININEEGVKSGISTLTNGLGDAGNITMIAQDMISLQQGGVITSSSRGNGHAGDITLKTNDIVIGGGANNFETYITSRALGSGNAGSITIHADGNIKLSDSGLISTATKAGGSAGSVTITADKLFIDSDGSVTSDSIGRLSSGKTGTIDIKIKDQLHVNSGSLRIINEAQNLTTAEAADINPGAINISANEIILTDSTITSASSGNVDAGDININAVGRLILNPSSITTNANKGNGGNIQIKSGAIIRLQNANITTNVKGATGNGGDITIDAEQLIMQTGLIQANTVAKGGLGGDIRLALNALIASGNRLRLGGTEPLLWQPNSFGNNIIQAAAPSGLSGRIESSAPQLNLSGELANLGTLNFGSVFLSRDYCSLGSGSSLTHTGKGGLTLKGRDAWVY